MSQDCKRFEDSLLELAYGELEESTADELRMHATECHKCRDELEGILLTRKLAARLPMAEPLGDLDSIILSAASKQAELNSMESGVEATVKIGSPTDQRSTIVQTATALDWLRSFLLRPAFATAALATLIFVFTFFLTEKGFSPVEREQDALDIPSPVSTLEESRNEEQADEPVEKEEAKQDVEGDRLASDEAPKTSDLFKDKTKTVEPIRERSEAYRSSDTKSSRKSAAGRGGFEDLTTIPDAPKPAGSKNVETKGELSDDLSKNLDGVMGGSFAMPPPSGDVSSSGAGGGSLGSDTRSVAQAESPSAQPVLDEEIQATESSGAAQTAGIEYASESESDSESDFDRGVAAYSRGDCKSAVAFFSRIVEQTSIYASNRAYAMHHIAKCEKRRGKFANAEAWYNKLLILYPSYNGKAEALFESAGCLSRMGQLEQARKRLRELTLIPAWTDRAKSELERISD